MVKYGTLYEEFENTGPIMWIMYTIFICRRTAIFLTVFFNCSVEVNISVSVVFALIVIFIQMAAYIVTTRNFKSSALCVYHFINEMLIALNYIVIYIGIYNEEYQKSSGYAYFCIYSISCAMFLNICFYIGIKVRQVYLKFVEWMKERKNKVHPAVTTITDDKWTKGENKKDVKSDWSFDKNLFRKRREISRVKKI